MFAIGNSLLYKKEIKLHSPMHIFRAIPISARRSLNSLKTETKQNKWRTKNINPRKQNKKTKKNLLHKACLPKTVYNKIICKALSAVYSTPSIHQYNYFSKACIYAALLSFSWHCTIFFFKYVASISPTVFVYFKKFTLRLKPSIFFRASHFLIKR